MKRRALDAMDLLARLFEVAHADHKGEEEGGDPDEASPGSAPHRAIRGWGCACWRG